MQIRGDHIIRRLVLDLQLEGQREEVFALQNALKECLKEAVAKQLDDVFSRLIPEGEVLRIPRLEVHLGALPRSKMTRNFEQSCLLAIEEKLRDTVATRHLQGILPGASESLPQETDPSRLPIADSLYRQFVHFLHYGNLPWWRRSWEEWETAVQKALSARNPSALRKELQTYIGTDTDILNRLLWQFSTPFLDTLLQQFTVETQRRNTDRSRLQEELRRTLKPGGTARSSASGRTSQNKDTTDKSLSGKGAKAGDVPTGVDQLAVEEREKLPSLSGGYFINNAGLALVIPCLYALFAKLEYLDSAGRFVSFEVQVKAIQLLQFIGAGETEAPEHLLALNKVACGLPPSEAIPRFIPLTEEEKEAGEIFLKAIIRHVPKLKNTSIDGLRQSFLLREGRLAEKNNHWWLKVTPQSYDPFLLDQLPWSLSLIKFRWMDRRLDVEWI